VTIASCAAGQNSQYWAKASNLEVVHDATSIVHPAPVWAIETIVSANPRPDTSSSLLDHYSTFHATSRARPCCFPSLCLSTGGVPAQEADVSLEYCGVPTAMKPKRRRTRAQNRIQRVASERRQNQDARDPAGRVRELRPAGLIRRRTTRRPPTVLTSRISSGNLILEALYTAQPKRRFRPWPARATKPK
jgi:hypothetical protein